MSGRIVLLATFIAFSVSVVPRAFTQPTDADTITAMGEVGGELQICSVYFAVVGHCVAPQRHDLGKTYLESSNRIGTVGITSQRSAGVSDQAMVAQQKLYTDHMIKAMGGNCTNIAVLLEKYSDFCKRLNEDGDSRLRDWFACAHNHQQTCNGPGLP